MPVTAVIGAQFGDEGKGKVVDYLAEDADVVARFQGGNNAGHTVVVGGESFALRLLPSGVVHEGTRNVIANGVVVDPFGLVKEMDDLAARGRRFHLAVSDRAHVILPIHQALDGAAEDTRGSPVGTTRRGIGPAYADKAARSGLRVGDLVAGDLDGRLEALLPPHGAVLRHYGKEAKLDAKQLAEELAAPARRLKTLVVDTVAMLNDAVDDGEEVLLEGAQGTFLDVDHGTYPFVTSSSTTAGGACTGTGIPPTRVDDVVGVVKAYATRVGSGPMPSELADASGAHLVEKGREFGTVTGRRRRPGWLDLVMLRRACRINGFTSLVVTKLDVLAGLDRIFVCEAYDVNGTETDQVPGRVEDLARAKPVLREFPGFELPAGSTDLPPKAVAYLEAIEDDVGVPIALVGTGPDREHMIQLD